MPPKKSKKSASDAGANIDASQRKVKKSVSDASAASDVPPQKKTLPRKWRRAETADDWHRRELEKKCSTKYHYVKFVERKKVERKLKSCRRELEQALADGKSKEAGALRAQLRTHLADYEYVAHYPRHLPYNALFPAEDNEASIRRREEIRKLIRTQLQNEGKEAVPAPTEMPSPNEDGDKPATGKKKRKGKPSEGAAEAGEEDPASAAVSSTGRRRAKTAQRALRKKEQARAKRKLAREAAKD